MAGRGVSQRPGMKHAGVQFVSGIAVGVLCLLLLLTPLYTPPNVKVSRLGEYSGYSQALYSSWVRTSEYVTVRDNTRLAVDIIRPAVGREPVETPLPVLLTFERYHRAKKVGNKIQSQAELSPFVPLWLKHGYIVVAVDARGTGASFGSREMEFNDNEDVYDVIEWIARQSWSSGKIGMYGFSYPGMTQLMGAAEAPAALKAIMPRMVAFDGYDTGYPGGIYNHKFIDAWSRVVQTLDIDTPGVPVDADVDGTLAAAAQQEHQHNVNLAALAGPDTGYRDALVSDKHQPLFLDMSLHRLIDKINRSGVAVYQIAGWYDLFVRGQAAWFNNLTVPQRIVFAPFSHTSGFDSSWQHYIATTGSTMTVQSAITFQANEHLRFFDYHLKGIDNGIMSEPPVWYYVMGAPADKAWRSATQWPLPEQVLTNFYFQPNGLLDQSASADDQTSDTYIVDYTTSSGSGSRWHNATGTPFMYGDMAPLAHKSLTYTTAALAEPTEVTGHPVIHLWVSSSAPDVDLFVYLEEVTPQGHAIYITEGMLRASHRALHDPPYRYMDLPYHRSFKGDIQPMLNGEPVELVFDLLPTSNIFNAGNRIRIRIVGADRDNFETPVLNPPPTIKVYHRSLLILPIVVFR